MLDPVDRAKLYFGVPKTLVTGVPKILVTGVAKSLVNGVPKKANVFKKVDSKHLVFLSFRVALNGLFRNIL